MDNSFQGPRKGSKSGSVLSREIMQTLTYQERKFAKQEFKKIYSQQMSKLSQELQHQKRMQQNRQVQVEDQSKVHNQQHEKVMKKIAQSDRRRQQNLEKKVKECKMNDERWHMKMEEIQKNYKIKNKEAMQKAEEYRRKTQVYWENKRKKNQSTRSGLISMEHSSHFDHPNNKFGSMPHNSQLPKIKTTTQNNSKKQTSKTVYTPCKSRNIDTQIRDHQQRVITLNAQREQQTIKKTLEKLNRIQSRRKAKRHENKIIQPTIVRKVPQRSYTIQDMTQDYKQSSQKHTLRNQLSKSRELRSLSREKESIEEIIEKHHQVKERKQFEEVRVFHIQFLQRGDILQKSIKRTKKTKIMKLIKQKVHNMKLKTIKSVQETT